MFPIYKQMKLNTLVSLNRGIWKANSLSLREYPATKRWSCRAALPARHFRSWGAARRPGSSLQESCPLARRTETPEWLPRVDLHIRTNQIDTKVSRWARLDCICVLIYTQKFIYWDNDVLYNDMLMNILVSSWGVIPFCDPAVNTTIEGISQTFDFIHIHYFLWMYHLSNYHLLISTLP